MKHLFFVTITAMIMFIIWGLSCNGQTVEINPKTEPAVAPSIIFAGGVSGAWLSVNRANLKDPEARGYDPSYTYITCKFLPIVTRKGDGWEITFTSEIAKGIP